MYGNLNESFFFLVFLLVGSGILFVSCAGNNLEFDSLGRFVGFIPWTYSHAGLSAITLFLPIMCKRKAYQNTWLYSNARD
jgi:hypothetical protein